MSRVNLINAKDLLKKQLQNSEFRREYENLDEEFTLAKEIIKLRKKAKLTQKELAKKSGTSQPAIARLESGEYTNMTLGFLRRIGEPLGVTPEIHFKKSRVF